MRICRAFIMKDAEAALKHINKHTKTVQKYGSAAHGHSLYVWDDGERRLLYCETCKAYILAQWSEYHSFTDSPDGYYDDYFPVVGETDADYLNQIFNGDTIEQEYEGCMLKRTNHFKNWANFGKFVEYKTASKSDFVRYTVNDIEIPEAVDADDTLDIEDITLDIEDESEETENITLDIEDAVFDSNLWEDNTEATSNGQTNKGIYITDKVKAYVDKVTGNKDSIYVNSVALYKQLLQDALNNKPLYCFTVPKVSNESETILRKVYPCGDLKLFVQYEWASLSVDTFAYVTAYMMLVDGDTDFIKAINNKYNTDAFIFDASNDFKEGTVYIKVPKDKKYTNEEIAALFESGKEQVIESP